MTRFILFVLCAVFYGAQSGVPGTAAAQIAPAWAGPHVDHEGLLSEEAAAEIQVAAREFRQASGHRMVIVVSSAPPGGDMAAELFKSDAEASAIPVGIVYSVSKGQKLGRLTVVAPAWRAVAHVSWIPMFPQRLLQKYGDEPFERRVVKSAHYLARTFPDKIAFLLKPDSGPISEESTELARRMMKAIEYFCYFIILFTFYRTFFPARVRDEDTDDFSNELRRLKQERQIW